jgi:hypothetical protein
MDSHHVRRLVHFVQLFFIFLEEFLRESILFPRLLGGFQKLGDCAVVLTLDGLRYSNCSYGRHEHHWFSLTDCSLFPQMLIWALTEMIAKQITGPTMGEAWSSYMIGCNMTILEFGGSNKPTWQGALR